MNEREESYVAIDVTWPLIAVWKYKYIIILFALIAVILSVIHIRCFTPDTYTASVAVNCDKMSDDIYFVNNKHKPKYMLTALPDKIQKKYISGWMYEYNNFYCFSK